MRILLISKDYPPDEINGGIAVRVVINAKSLAERGHNVHVLSCKENQKSRDYEDSGVIIHRRPLIHFKRAKRIIYNWLKMPQTYRRLKSGISNYIHMQRLKYDFDVIEYPDYGADGWLISMLRKSKSCCRLDSPLFIHPFNNGKKSWANSSFIDHQLASRLEHRTIENSRIVIAPSKYIVNALKQLGWLKKLKVYYVVPNPIDWSEWQDVRSVIESEPVVLFIGRIQSNKAPEILCKAITIIREKLPDARAVFIGRPSKSNHNFGFKTPESEYERKLLEGCEFTGQIPRHEIKNYMAKARVFALPSLSESYSNAAMEAMASGRPVVVTINTGISELVEGSDSGKVVPVGDPKAIADELLPYLMNKSLALNGGLFARNQIIANNDPGIIASKLEDIYLKELFFTNNTN